MARQTVIAHNPHRGPIPKVKQGKKKPMPAKKKTAKKKPGAAKKKRRNPAPKAAATTSRANPRKRARKRTSGALVVHRGGHVVTHRRRARRRNPAIQWSEILGPALVGLATPTIITAGALQLAKMEPTRTKLYTRIAGALAAVAGAYVVTQTKHQAMGAALIAGGAGAAFANEATMWILGKLNNGGAPGTGPVASSPKIGALVEQEMGALVEMGALAEIGALDDDGLAEFAARIERMRPYAARY